MERTRRGARAAHVQGLRRRTPEARPNRLHARVEGWEMHASTAFEARERDAIERFCRYALRGPIANGRLTRGPRTLEHLAVELERIHLAAEARLDAERAKMLGGRARRRMPELGGARPQRLAEDLPADHDDRRDRELGRMARRLDAWDAEAMLEARDRAAIDVAEHGDVVLEPVVAHQPFERNAQRRGRATRVIEHVEHTGLDPTGHVEPERVVPREPRRLVPQLRLDRERDARIRILRDRRIEPRQLAQPLRLHAPRSRRLNDHRADARRDRDRRQSGHHYR
nr:MAG: hypothetical protein DIU78_25630 [Pseudomonadota bacterium]